MMAAWGLHDVACFSCSMAAEAGEKEQLDTIMTTTPIFSLATLKSCTILLEITSS